MAERKLSSFSGNKFSLRAKPSQMIKRIEGLSTILGSLGDFLVTTWMGIIGAIFVIAIGTAIGWYVVSSNSFSTLTSNIYPLALIILATILLALNAVLTDPSKGLQLLVSFNFFKKKIVDVNSKHWVKFAIFKFYEKDESQSTIEVLQPKNRVKFLAIYQTRGIVSPVAFSSELEEATFSNRSLLENMERETTTTKIISIETTKVAKVHLPANATEGMKKRRDLMYQVTNNRPSNQQLKTSFVVSSPTPQILRLRTKSAERALNQNLVVGFKRLQGKEAINAIKGIYGI